MLVVRALYTDFEELWAPFPSGVAPSGAFCASLDEAGRAAPPLCARAWIAVGTVPRS